MLHIDQSPLSPRILEILRRNPIENNQLIESKEIITEPNILGKFPTELMEIIFRYLLIDEYGDFCKNKITLLMLVSRQFLGVINEILTYRSDAQSYWIEEQMEYCYKGVRKLLMRYEADSESLKSYAEDILNSVQHIDVDAKKFEDVPNPMYEYFKCVGTYAAHLASLNPVKSADVSASILQLLKVLSCKKDIQTLNFSISLNNTSNSNRNSSILLCLREENDFQDGDNDYTEPEDDFSDEEYNNIIKKRNEKIISIGLFSLIDSISAILNNNSKLNRLDVSLIDCGFGNWEARNLLDILKDSPIETLNLGGNGLSSDLLKYNENLDRNGRPPIKLYI